MWRGTMEAARAYARQRNWRLALSELRTVFQATGGDITAANYLVRKPLAYCLVQWVVDDLKVLKASEGLSRPLRLLMRIAADLKKWGGTFNRHECPLCERNDPQGRGCTKVKTAVGWAYLCCAAPTKNDMMLARMAEALRDRLELARALDSSNESATLGAAALPESLRLLLTENESSWAQQGSADEPADFWANLLGAVVQNSASR
jgi:hypothetical protein